MSLADARIREVKPLSFIYEKERALPPDVCAEAIRRFEASADRPAQGKLLLFPPFWTHVHRGVTLEKGVKYIATSWVCFA
jgi:hypothetical protein